MAEPRPPNKQERATKDDHPGAASLNQLATVQFLPEPPKDLPRWQQTGVEYQPGSAAKTMDSFNQMVTAHVQSMLSKVMMEHQGSVLALQSEIASLQRKLEDANKRLRQDQGVHLQTNSVVQFSGSTPAATQQKVGPQLQATGVGVLSGSTPALTQQKVGPQLQTNSVGVFSGSTPASTQQKVGVQLQTTSVGELSGSTPASTQQKVGGGSTASSTKPAAPPESTRRSLSSVDMLYENMGHKHHASKKKVSKEQDGRPFLQRAVMSNAFEILSSAVIVANTGVIAVQLQYDGFDIGNSIRPLTYPEPSENMWPGAESVFTVFDALFNAVFCLELLLRLYAYRLRSVCMPWMWFDVIIIALGLADTIFGSSGLGIDPTTIRLARLVRLVRIMKVFKAMSAFDSLFLLTKSIYASVSALMWSFLLLLFVQIATACFLCQALQGFVSDEGHDDAARDRVFKFFGTFSRSMLTMFEITFANWVPSCRVLYEDVHELFFLFYVAYRCMFIFFLMKVIMGVFMAETSRVLENDVELTVMKAAREKAAFKRRAKIVLDKVDQDHDGTITEDELHLYLEDPDMSAILASLGVSKDDFEKLFWLVEINGSVNEDRLLNMVSQLKGQAKTVDLLNLFKFIHKMNLRLQKALNLDVDCEEEALAELAEGGHMQQGDDVNDDLNVCLDPKLE